MGGPQPRARGAAVEIPLLLSFFHLPGRAGRRAPSGLSLLALSGRTRGARPAPGTVTGGEFDWGGTPVKR